MAASEDKKMLFEQYKLAVEMADRISARRGIANGFYFTVSSGLLAAAESFGLAKASGAGLLLACAWWLQLRSYRKLNAAKWTVISALEKELPAKPFTDEWDVLKSDPLDAAVARLKHLTGALSPLARYPELSLIEQVVPLVFVVLFGVTLWSTT